MTEATALHCGVALEVPYRGYISLEPRSELSALAWTIHARVQAQAAYPSDDRVTVDLQRTCILVIDLVEAKRTNTKGERTKMVGSVSFRSSTRL